ncbi:MAG: hypothetical protein NT086_11215 [Proteobacteria bacterium]|nr:hypothetical protein [Pseudomonadota bacterium]
MADLLEELAKGKPQSKAARLRAALPDIDAALADGYSHKEILAILNQSGLDLSFEVYQTTLFRIRKPQKKEKPRDPATPTPAKETPAAATPAATNPTNGKKSFVYDKTPPINIWE